MAPGWPVIRERYSDLVVRPREIPILKSVQVRKIESHDHIDFTITAVDRPPVFLRDGLGLLRGNVDFDVSSVIEYHSAVFANTVFPAVVGDEQRPALTSSTLLAQRVAEDCCCAEVDKITKPYLLGRLAGLRFFQAYHGPLLRLAIGEVQQCAGFVFGQVVNPGFHNRPVFPNWSPGSTL